MWISAFDSNGEGEHWYWQTGPEKGQLVEYFAWGPNSPSSGLSCVNIHYKKLPTYTTAFWDSDPCESSDPAALNDVLVEFECPAGLGFGDSGCEEIGVYNADRTHYYAPYWDPSNWGDSVEIAKNHVFKCRQGHLASFTSKAEYDEISSPFLDKVGHFSLWIGANDIAVKGYHVWVDGPDAGHRVHWDDGSFGWVEDNGVGACSQYRRDGFYKTECDIITSPLIEYECPDGFYFGEQCCEVINQCQINNGGCGQNSQCLKNSKGPYFCRCNAGYISTSNQRDGKNCVPIDACNRPSPFAQHSTCGENSDCTYVNGVINCACRKGYFSKTGDGRYCLPLTPCSINNGGCGGNSTCTNPGPNIVTCTCNNGYTSANVPKNGRNCIAINLCLAHRKVCGAHSTCTYTGPGTYTCACDDGYLTDRPDGKNCMKVTTPDIDPQPFTTGAPVTKP